MKFELDVWYIGALKDEVEPGPVGRTIAHKNVVFFRDSSGDVGAIADYCPHRFALLSMGKVVNGNLRCPYHGLEFNGQGRCVHNPQSDLIAPNAHVPGYPVVERYGFVWVWLGNPAMADESLIPDLSEYETSDTRVMCNQYVLAKYRADLLVDNQLDYTHVTYIHEGSFSTAPGTRQEFFSKAVGSTVEFGMRRFNSPAPPRDRDLGEFVDEQYKATWYPGNVMPMMKSTVAQGQPFEEGRKTVFGHIPTPCDDNTTHYFFYVTRYHALDDEELTQKMKAYQLSIVDGEDGPILEGVHKCMNGAELMDLKPLVLEGDTGSMLVRRTIARRLREEEKRNGAHA